MSYKPRDVELKKVLVTTFPFVIPRYQRYYVWGVKQWEDLFEDIIFSLSNSGPIKYHFIGSFIFEEQKDKYVVIDGQQRLTTLCILLAVTAKFFCYYGQEAYYKGLKQYNYYTDLNGEDKLRLQNEDFEILNIIINNFCFGKNKELDLKKFLENEKINYKKREERLIDCCQFYLQKMTKYISSITDEDKISLIAKFRDGILNLKVMEIVAYEEQEGYILFETLNSKGVPLENHELLKNYIFMYDRDTSGSDAAKRKWQNIMSNTEECGIDNFISHYITHAFGKVPEKEEFNIIKSNVKKENVPDLLKDLVEKSEIYKNICFPSEKKYTSEIRNCLYFFKDYNFKQVRPILMSYFEALELNKITMEQLEKNLKFLKKFLSLFVLICDGKTNSLETIIYNNAPILHQEYNTENNNEFISKIRQKVPSKNDFCNSFVKLAYSKYPDLYPEIKMQKKKCKYILSEYEAYLSKKEEICKIPTIEHIKNDSELGSACYIGNLIPLSKSINGKLKNLNPKFKMVKYEISGFASTSKLCNRLKDNLDKRNDDELIWTDKDIDSRSMHLAVEFYDNIWKL